MPLPSNQVQSKAFVTLSELAEDVLGISRARLYELIERGSMPQPIYDLRTRRPLFDETLQRQALAVRQTGIGVDGSVVIWYRRNRRTPAGSSYTPSRARQRTSSSQRSYAELVSNLQSLGVSNADERSVAAAVAECFPNGIETQQDSDVLRVLFRHLRRRASA